jgi:hypothetical protein
MEDSKQKLKKSILAGSSSLSSYFVNPGYHLSYYFGNSSFYGDRVHRFTDRNDMWRKEKIDFVPVQYKAIGRQMMK